MTLNAQFVINNNSNITITVPSLPEKMNDIFPPTEQLHSLDIATVTYNEHQKKKLTLHKEVIDEVLYSYYLVLERVLERAFTLPERVNIGDVGYYLNIYREYRTHDLAVLDQFRVWCSKQHIQTLLYNTNNNIYLEIIPLYPWHLAIPETDDEYEPFDAFMQRYTPYVVTEVARENVITWRDKCYNLLKDIIDESRIPSQQEIMTNPDL